MFRGDEEILRDEGSTRDSAMSQDVNISPGKSQDARDTSSCHCGIGARLKNVKHLRVFGTPEFDVVYVELKTQTQH